MKLLKIKIEEEKLKIIIFRKQNIKLYFGNDFFYKIKF